MPKVVFVTETTTKKDFYESVLKDEPFEIKFCDNPTELYIPKFSQPDFVFIDICDHDTFEKFLTSIETFKEIRKALITNISDSDYINRLLKDIRFELLIPKNHTLESGEEVCSEQDLNFISKLIATQNFTVENHDKVAPLQTIEITNIIDKNPAIDKIRDAALDQGYKSVLLEKINVLLDEMITNAVFHAPVDENGNFKYTKLPRNSSFELQPNETVTVKYSINDDIIIVKVFDNFGRLTWDTYSKYLKNALAFIKEGKKGHMRMNHVGGGIGFGLLFLMSHYLLIRVDPHKQTEITIILKNIKRRRDADNTPKLMYFFDVIKKNS